MLFVEFYLTIINSIMKKLFFKLVVLIPFLFILHSEFFIQNSEAQWVQITKKIDYNGPVGSITFSGNKIFTGTGSGVYFSTNNGTIWAQSTLNNRNIYPLTSYGNNIFAGTVDYGVFSSTDNGSNWTQTLSALNDKTIYSLVVNENNVFAGTNGYGVYLSTNNGTNWVQTSLDNQLVLSLAISGNNIFAGTWGNGVYLSTNYGLSWTQTTLNNRKVNCFLLSGTNIFAGVDGWGVYISTNNGTNWTNVSNGLISGYVLSLAVIGTNIFAGTGSISGFGEGIYRSTNNGETWTQIFFNMPINDLEVNGNIIYASSSLLNINGVFQSTNNGTTWFMLPYEINALYASSNNIYTGAKYGLFSSLDSGLNWSPKNINLKNISSILKKDNYLFAGTQDSGIYYTTNDGMNWIQTPLNNKKITSIVSKNSRILAGTSPFSGIYYSTNNGLNWTQSSLNFVTVNTLFVIGSNIYAGTNLDGIYISTDDGNNWYQIALPSTSINAFCEAGGRLFAGTDNQGVYLSTNNGENWIQTALNNKTIKSLNSYGNSILAGASGYGVYLSNNLGNQWAQVNDGLSNLNVNSLYSLERYLITGTNDGLSRRYISPSSPVLVSPANNSNNIPLNMNLIWKRMKFSAEYNVVLATDISFNNIIADTTLIDTIKNIGGLSYLSTYYWKVRGKTGTIWDDFSNTWTFTTIPNAPTVAPNLITPTNNSINLSLTPALDWSDVSTASIYNVMVSTDSIFNTYAVFDSSTTSQYTVPVNKLTYDTKYFWRARGKNISGVGPWSTVWNFRTVLSSPRLDTLIKNNKSITINWSQIPPNSNIIKFKIYRGLSSPASTLIDSVAGNQFTYTNTNLTNGTTYFYRIKSVNNQNIESDFSNEKSASPFNRPPAANPLTSVNNPNIGRVLTQNQVFNSSGSTDPDGTIDSVFWYVNNQLISSAGSLASLNYNFLQGLNSVKLIVKDNDGLRDSSFANVSLSTFRKYFGGSNSSGLSMIGDSTLFAIITQGSNSAVNKLDINGNTTLTLNVNGNILSSSCIGYDTTIFIGSTDNNLYAFSRYGVSLWSPLPLGGQLVASPTLDSSANRVYVGVSNNNFFCVNKLTGQIIWSMFGNSPIRNSAVITNNKRLFVTSQSGTIYGVDLNNLNISGGVVTPNWTINSGDTITSSPAIDQSGNFYVGTVNGKLKKIQMTTGLPGTVLWETVLGGSINASPVIDANGNIYVGSTNGKFYAVKSDGNIKWEFTTSGQINTTAAISKYSRLYFGNTNGDFYSIDTNKSLKWYYKDSSAIGNCVIASKGSIYYGTSAGVLAAFYDYIETDNRNLTSVNVWPTYQSDNQRTGSRGYNTTVVRNLSEIIPDKFELHQNYPNPFNPSTTIRFGIVKQTNVKILIYDVLGRQVAILVSSSFQPGTYEVEWDASFYSSGIYYYIMQTEDFRQIKRMVLIK